MSLPETIPQATMPTAHPPQRRIICDLCWAPAGRCCTVSGPPGDHVARLITAVRLGLLSRAELAAVVGGLAVIAEHVVIVEVAA